MKDWIIMNESSIRLGFFLDIFLLMAILETQFPRRIIDGQLLRRVRWPNNFSLIIIASLFVRFILPLSLISFAIICQQSGWGLFNLDFFKQFSSISIFIVSLTLFDLIIYWQHRIFHCIPLLWRLHKVHHSDQAFDVTTGIRFHPLEILLSIAVKFLVIFILGLSAESIIAFEVILNGLALFNHSNVKLPLKIDHYVRKIIVTPDMHRVHHSQVVSETNSNYGFNISAWDHLFSSYQAQPSLGHDAMNIGLTEYQNKEIPKKLSKLLIMPFEPKRSPAAKATSKHDQ